MKENFTLLYLVDNIENFSDLISFPELFDIDPHLSGFISEELAKFEMSPPDRIIRNILSEFQK